MAVFLSDWQWTVSAGTKSGQNCGQNNDPDSDPNTYDSEITYTPPATPQENVTISVQFETASDSFTFDVVAPHGCGECLTDAEWNALSPVFPNLVRSHSSKLEEAITVYNCIAWSVGRTDIWINDTGDFSGDPSKESMDWDYGNRNGLLEVADIDAFFNAYGLSPVPDTGFENADVVYYSNYHAAKKAACGYGHGNRFSSKLGEYIRMEHDGQELNGPTYGNGIYFYIAQE